MPIVAAYVRFATRAGFRPDFCEAADPESKGVVAAAGPLCPGRPGGPGGGWDGEGDTKRGRLEPGGWSGRATSRTRTLVDYRSLARRNLPSLLTYKFLNEYGYDKGPMVVKSIVDDICDMVRTYFKHSTDIEPGQLIYLAPVKGQGRGRGKTIAKTKARAGHAHRRGARGH